MSFGSYRSNLPSSSTFAGNFGWLFPFALSQAGEKSGSGGMPCWYA
ncbi:MAG: hypothetical protein WCB19_05800 [Thermoplasmata archaeon]